jgi:hypothetical protein
MQPPWRSDDERPVTDGVTGRAEKDFLQLPPGGIKD